MEDLSILSSRSFFLILNSQGEAWQSISSSSGLALAVIDSEIVLRELLGSADLSGAQALRNVIHEPTEVVVIRKHKNPMLEALEGMPPGFKGFNNGQKLTVVSFKCPLESSF